MTIVESCAAIRAEIAEGAIASTRMRSYHRGNLEDWER
jgi:hypothetical protein